MRNNSRGGAPLPAINWSLDQRLQAGAYATAVEVALLQTPAADKQASLDAAAAMLRITAVYLPRDMSDPERDAWGAAYADAVGDVPEWATQEALRRWHRGECGKEFDYRFAPKPAELRAIANAIAFLAAWQALTIRKLLEMKP